MTDSASLANWWKNAVIYEIYPRSFQDSNGDGVGDLNGITQRLDYLKTLGVDAIWLSPIYPSPQVDFGYDISDYENIDPQYGTLADFDRLVAEAKKRDIRIVMDMVYRPRETELLQLARKKKIEVISGVEMFLAQGFAQYEIWTGRRAPESAMRRVVETALDKEEKPKWRRS